MAVTDETMPHANLASNVPSDGVAPPGTPGEDSLGHEPAPTYTDRLEALIGSLGAKPLNVPDWPVRQQSCWGSPKPSTSIERTCQCCGASFLKLAPGKTGLRGLWRDSQWFCSQECFDKP
jgi:hypothetical protein